jgi:endogenous inhibitor of DNA gyrase (YacG/DUF329 family)
MTPEVCPKCSTPVQDAPGIGPFCPNHECDVVDDLLGEFTFTIAPDSRDAATRATVEAEIVAWLCRFSDGMPTYGQRICSRIAAAIEAGEHREKR